MDQVAILAKTNDPLLNFTIVSGQANNSGTDVKDLGLLFDTTGSLNWNNCRMSRIPYVFNFTIITPNVGPGQMVHFNLEARRND